MYLMMEELARDRMQQVHRDLEQQRAVRAYSRRRRALRRAQAAK